MEMRRVWVEGNSIHSEMKAVVDNSKMGGGRLTRINTFIMDKAEAKRQLEWIQKGLDKAKDQAKHFKHNLSPDGRKNLMFLEKQKLVQANKEAQKLKEAKDEYEKALAKL